MLENMQVARIFPIFKSRDEKDASNHRGISLLDVGYKILTAIVAKRLKPQLF